MPKRATKLARHVMRLNGSKSQASFLAPGNLSTIKRAKQLRRTDGGISRKLLLRARYIRSSRSGRQGTINPYGEDFEFFRHIKPIEPARPKNSKTSLL